MVRADFLERVRRYSFLITLAFAVYLAYAAYTGTIVLRLDQYRGIYNSAWLGSLMGLVGSMFLSLVGFYVVKNSIQRDRDTRVGTVLASTSMSKSFYTLAKTASNFAVLASMVVILCAAALLMQLLRAEDPHINLWTLFSPLLFVALPATAFTSALAILFETLPVLRGGVGNVVFFFVWIGLLAAPASDSLNKNEPIPQKTFFYDLTGITSTMGQMQRAVGRIDPTYNNGAELNIGDFQGPPSKRFVWRGLEWTSTLILSRILWTALAVLLALIASIFFDRFDPAREWRMRKARPKQAALPETEMPAEPRPSPIPISTQLTPLPRTGGGVPFFTLVVAELRLMLKGRQWWWYAGAAIMLIGQFVAPAAQRAGFLLAAWIWPVLVWSQMGCREARNATSSLLFSSAHSLSRQLPALYAAGVLVACLTGTGAGFRLLVAADWHSLAAWLGAAVFIPSVALALGVWTNSSKAFEALYTVWWYVGPAHQMPSLDFMGLSARSSSPALYAVAALLLLSVSYLGRRTRLGYA